MPRRKVRPSVICPFYRGDEGQYIYCEGIAPGTTLRLGFVGISAKEHRTKRCCQDWKSCMLAQMLERKHKSS